MTPPPPPPANPFRDVHQVEQYIAKRTEELRGDGPIGETVQVNPSREQRDAILEFVEAKRSTVGKARIRMYVAWLPVLADRMKGEFLHPTKPKFQAAFDKAMPRMDGDRTEHGGLENGYKHGSRAGAAHVLETFWRWGLDARDEGIPKWLRVKLPKWKSAFGPGDMVTAADIRSMAAQCDNFRDSAFLWVAYSSGCRPGEIFRLRLKDVVSHPQGYIELMVHREKDSPPTPAPIYEDSVPALLNWVRSHPNAGNGNSPLWVGLRGPERGKPVQYFALLKMLHTAARKAGIQKPITLYALRRGRLTQLAKEGASQSLIERVAGWAPGSKHARNYIHLGAAETISELNQKYGIGEKVEEEHEAPRTPTTCGRCQIVNAAGAKFCSNCGGPLSLVAIEQLKEAEKAGEKLGALLEDPEVRKFLETKLAALFKAAKA